MSINASKVVANIGLLMRGIPAEAAAALSHEAEETMAISKSSYVPVDTGALRASGHVQRPTVGSREITVTMGYGGPGADYAIYVHENPTAHHEVGQWKYLEQPVTERSNGMLGRIAERINLARMVR